MSRTTQCYGIHFNNMTLRVIFGRDGQHFRDGHRENQKADTSKVAKCNFVTLDVITSNDRGMFRFFSSSIFKQKKSHFVH